MTSQVLTNSVIVAENDVQMRDLIRSVLSRVRLQVFPVADGAEALMLARRFTARLVLLDISMPRLNGLQTCTGIRNLPGYAEVPIVMLSSHDDDRFRVTAKRVGATSFITKPFRPAMLLTRLAEFLDYPQCWEPGSLYLPARS
jgi:DNA-binding response OmpR family regulator